MDTLVVVGVETLDEVDTDEDVETELEVDTLQREFKRNYPHKLVQVRSMMYRLEKWKRGTIWQYLLH